MNKTDSIARRILGWKLNRWDRWYDYENNVFIHDSEFQPEENLDHAMLIVEKLEKVGFSYTSNGVSEVSFNNIRATGETLPQAITNAAYSIIEKNSITDSSRIWQQMC
ncbi:BC1872 family protein [Neobacillus sp. LXY-4]|uniref:BC1872 family protein n=1 Tax=Neobacillus sp. LXY-4 TaxID=3379826 RepID=UPI003EE0CBB5